MGTNARKRQSFVRQIVVLVGCVLAVAFGWQAYSEHQQRKDLLVVHFSAPDGRKSPQYFLRVAATEPARRQGLMYEPAEHLTHRRGMLFVFPEQSEHSFWMKNTPTSLDMIFLDSSRIVVGIIDRTTPFSTETRSVGVPSQYVVELLAGTAAQDGIAVGAKLESELVLPVGQ